MDKEDIKNFFEEQLGRWDLASKNYQSLKKIRKKPFELGQLTGWVQYNPARAASALAKVDKDSIRHRDCFLCDKHRPKEQNYFEIIPNWKLMVNPYPILPYHFTIVYRDHSPQKLNYKEGRALAEAMPGFIIFYNDPGAGASAPDHAHFQAVPQGSLPLIRAVEEDPDFKAPFQIIRTPEELIRLNSPLNAFFWLNEKDNQVKFLGIPRKAHRPDLFYMPPPLRRAVSPGAIDMTGVVVTPFEEDFERIDSKDLENIFGQVAFM